MKPAHFQIAHRGQMFPGFASDELWNGWECPYFEGRVADTLHIELPGLYYDADRDAYILDLRLVEPDQGDDYEPDVFPAYVTPEGLKLYPVGAWTLCWTLWEG